ncbi:MAG TPA: cyclase [Microbacteriaceae bacterium]|jgi:kynurenine formamidase|nr:cyclase [Microbacteriaceae bacterium]
MTDYRASFDARVEFANGGGLTAEGFRIDLPSAGASEAEVARLFVQHLGLALVSSVSLTGLTIVEEQHRGTRGIAAAPPANRGRLVDLSHTIRAGLITYPGLPSPVITPHLTREQSIGKYAPGTQFAMDIITMIGNTGTYIDSPFHRYEGGTDLAGLPLETLVDQPAEVFHLQDVSSRGIPASVFFDRDLAGKAVLLHTGWSANFGLPAYATGAPFLTGGGAEYLAAQGVTLVGIDSLNIDDTEGGGERPAHSVLLRVGVHVVEHLTNLDSLPPSGSTVTAVPPKVEGFGTFPVRVFARVG